MAVWFSVISFFVYPVYRPAWS